MSSPNGHSHKTSRSQPAEEPVLGPQIPPLGAPRPLEPPVPSSQGAVAEEFERLLASNQAKFAELAARGASPDPFFLVHARINHLIDAIAQATGPNGPRWAAMTRLGFEKYIASELEQAGPATQRMQLAEGARYTPEMIRMLAAQTGTLRRRPQ